MRYAFYCNNDDHHFVANVPVDDRDEMIECPICHRCTAHRVFDPTSVFITSNFQNLRTTRFQDYHGFDSTPEHSANYLYHQKDEQNQKMFYDDWASRKPIKPFEQRLQEKYPDTDLQLNRKVTREDVRKALINLNDPKANLH